MNRRPAAFQFIVQRSRFSLTAVPGCARLALARKMPFLYTCGARPNGRADRRRPNVSLGPYSSAVFMTHLGGFFVKHAFRLSRAGSLAAVALLLLVGATAARAQTLTPTPDTVIFQVTNSTIPAFPTPTPSPTPTPTGTPTPTPVPGVFNRESFAGDASGDGRFVVIESSGDISTERSDARNNRDGNQEIFLFDYAQRRIFQITDTKSLLKDAAAAPIDPNNIEVRVVNLRPVISHDGRYIAFVSNGYSDTLTPKQFDGQANAAALRADGNTEIFLYQIPAVAAADLSSGAEVAPVDLAAGTMTRVTNTPASSLPRAGTTIVPPAFALDNDGPAINDDGSYVAFVSQAKSGIPGESNADGNKEIFVYNRTSGGFVQVTTTQDVAPSGANPLGTLVFNESPSLSGSGGAIAFISNADIGTSESAADKGNGEIYVASFSGSAVSNLRAVTQTPRVIVSGVETGVSTNLLNPGRRMSRDGNLLAFESLANFNPNGSLPSPALAGSTGVYVYNISSGAFTLVAARPNSDQNDVGFRVPTFTGDSSRILFTSNLNYNADGTVNTSTTEGLNPSRNSQVYAAPVTAFNQLSRLTNLAVGSFTAIQTFPSDTVRRVALSLAGNPGLENPDNNFEAFYLLLPTATSETTSVAVSFFTGASERAVVAATPTPTPPDVTGLAPGMLGLARSTTVTLAPSSREVNAADASETQRRPPLPVELNGVTVSVAGAAAGLYFVSSGQINFVVPRGLVATATALPVTIFNNGSVLRTSVALNAAQPDIFTSTNGAGGRAAVLNVTNKCVSPTGEPFSVTTTRPKDNVCTATETESAPTRLLIMLTGVRPVGSTTSVTVRIGTTDLTGTAIVSIGPSNTPGFEQIEVELPASLAGAGDVPVIVTVTSTGGTSFTSRPAESAPHITIQ
jgi:uncharacterized protein (TIGR03437 family)